jgi:hypothetical protein
MAAPHGFEESRSRTLAHATTSKEKIMNRLLVSTLIAGLVFGVLGFASTTQSRPSTSPNLPHEAGCSLESIRGSYGFYRSGTTPAGPLAGLGITNFDGRGGSSTIQSIRSTGEDTSDLFTDGAYDAMYSVDSNCSAKFINPDGSVFGHAVVVGGGEEIYIMSLSDHNTITGVMKRINPDLNR